MRSVRAWAGAPGARGVLRRALAGLLALLLVWLVVGYAVFVDPVRNRLRPADAIVVLGPVNTDNRQQYAFDLSGRYAPTILLSVSSQQAATKPTCNGSAIHKKVLCFVPRPATTQGEARQIRDWAAERHWHTVIVVTSSYQISRARMIIERCFTGRLIMASPPAGHSVLRTIYQYGYQSAGYARAWLVNRGC